MLICLDLDGTIVSPYISNHGQNYHDWQVLIGRRERLASLYAEGHTIAIVTTQAGVSLGHLSEADVAQKIQAVLVALRLPTTTPVAVCYAHPDARDERYRTPHELARRKPSGTMLRELMDAYPEAAAQGVVYVGDTARDQQMASDAGASFQWAWDFFSLAFDDVIEDTGQHSNQVMLSNVVHFDVQLLTLSVLRGALPAYEINLAACTDAARMLDAIFQLAQKPWCTPRTLYEVVQHADEACRQIHGMGVRELFGNARQQSPVQWNT
jgi:D-glycero-D-manno-heptose 1,7-bisphosphate phosphatase